MSDQDDDPFKDPAWLALAKNARETLEPMMRDSAIAVSMYSGGIDPKMALETGYMALLDKPILAVITQGAKVPNKLALVADEIIELAPDDPSFSERLNAAMMRIAAKEQEKQ